MKRSISAWACAASLLASFGCTSLGRNSGVSSGSASPISTAKKTYDVDIATRFAKSKNVELYSYHMKNIGNDQGLSSPILRTRDGGYLIVGTRGDNSTVIKLDATGNQRWEKSFPEKGFTVYEGASAIELNDGFVVFVLSFVRPEYGAVARILKIDQAGNRVWHLRLRGTGGKNTPFPSSIRLAGGTLKLSGHIYLDATETAYFWNGEVDLGGRLLRDAPGGKIRTWVNGEPVP